MRLTRLAGPILLLAAIIFAGFGGGRTGALAAPINGFNICLQDETNGNILQFSSTTGAYQFTHCPNAPISGTGSIRTRGCLITLEAAGPDRKLHAQTDTCLKVGTAAFQLLTGPMFTILDKNTSNNTCVCAVTG
jgi:hypothetical protein